MRFHEGRLSFLATSKQPVLHSAHLVKGRRGRGRERRSHALPRISFFWSVIGGTKLWHQASRVQCHLPHIFVEWLWQRYDVWVSSSTQWE